MYVYVSNRNFPGSLKSGGPSTNTAPLNTTLHTRHETTTPAKLTFRDESTEHVVLLDVIDYVAVPVEAIAGASALSVALVASFSVALMMLLPARLFRSGRHVRCRSCGRLRRQPQLCRKWKKVETGCIRFARKSFSSNYFPELIARNPFT